MKRIPLSATSPGAFRSSAPAKGFAAGRSLGSTSLHWPASDFSAREIA
jgi:hypothetical protein